MRADRLTNLLCQCVGASLVWFVALPILSFAATITVPGNYPTIQQAIDAANIGDTVVVSPGTYNENINFKGKDIVLKSTNHLSPSVVASTVIDGTLTTASVVMFSGSETLECVLAGFTIRNGRASDGGGINGNGCEATILNNVITNNEALLAYGGGVYHCDGTIMFNTISNNIADFGGGLFWCDGVIEENAIYGNSASSHGGGMDYCNGIIENNLIYDNTASENGGGIRYCINAIILNNTIYGNIANLGGGISECNPGTIKNNIIWGNTGLYGTQCAYIAAPTYCCIQNWSAGGTGNINSDPQMVDPANGDFHLQPTSPCIDAGGSVPLVGDYYGNPRPLNGTSEPRGDGSDFDIGAHEYQPPGGSPTPTLPPAAVMLKAWTCYE
jgi:serine protease